MKNLVYLLLLVTLVAVTAGCASTPSTAVDQIAQGAAISSLSLGPNTPAGHAAGVVALPFAVASLIKDVAELAQSGKRELTEDEKAYLELVTKDKKTFVAQKCMELLAEKPELVTKPNEEVQADKPFDFTSQNGKTYQVFCSAMPVYKNTTKRHLKLAFSYQGNFITKSGVVISAIDLNKLQATQVHQNTPQPQEQKQETKDNN
jgi:hypothetical protein